MTTDLVYTPTISNASGTDRFNVALEEREFPTLRRAKAYLDAATAPLFERGLREVSLVVWEHEPGRPHDTGTVVDRVRCTTPPPLVVPVIAPVVTEHVPAASRGKLGAGLDEREMATIVAGLRFVQVFLAGGAMSRERGRSLLSDHGDVAPMSIPEIDALLSRLDGD
jgi:hypothetical protein